MIGEREVEVRLGKGAALTVIEPVQLIGNGSVLTGEMVASGEGTRSIRLHPSLVFAQASEKITFQARPNIFWPGRQRSVRVRVDVAPPLGPGRLAAELWLGQSAVAAEVLVLESRQLTVLPDPVVVPNLPGPPVTVEVACRNDGNVPAFVGAIGPVQITGGRGSRLLRDVADEGDGEPPAFLVIDVLDGTEWIQPGRTESLRWAVTIPERLAPGELHAGAAPLSSTPVHFLVIPAPTASPRKPAARPSKARRPASDGPRRRPRRASAAPPDKPGEPPGT